MQSLLESWEEVEPLLKSYDVLLFLDYDGTLTPIAEHPRLAQLSEEGRLVLKDLVTLTENTQVIIISGRLLEELKQMVAIPGIHYVGNHGFEWEGPSIRQVHPAAVEGKALLKEILKKLENAFRDFLGIFVENKIFTLSLHYRELPEEQVESAKEIFLKILQPYVETSRVVLTEGKKVWEIRPGGVSWNKGTALLWLLSRVVAHSSRRVLPIYIGDDQTDEDAFKVIRNKGLGVKIVEKKNDPTEALYSLASPSEVFLFLKRIIEIKATHASALPDNGVGKTLKKKRSFPD